MKRLLVRDALLFVSFSTGLLPETAFPQDKPIAYVLDAANQMKQIEYSHAVLSGEDNARIVRIACDTLKRLADDSNLKATLDTSRKLDASRARIEALLKDLNEFDASFVPFEAGEMQRQGLDFPATNEAMQVALKSRTNAGASQPTAEEVIHTIRAAQERVCQFATAAVSARERAQTTWTFSGVVIIAVDAVAAAGIVAGTGGGGMPAAGTLAVASISIGLAATNAGIRGEVP